MSALVGWILETLSILIKTNHCLLEDHSCIVEFPTESMEKRNVFTMTFLYQNWIGFHGCCLKQLLMSTRWSLYWTTFVKWLGRRGAATNLPILTKSRTPMQSMGLQDSPHQSVSVSRTIMMSLTLHPIYKKVGDMPLCFFMSKYVFDLTLSIWALIGSS